MIKVLYYCIVFLLITTYSFAQSGEDSYKNQEYQKAIDEWEKVIQEEGAKSSTLYNQGNAYFMLGNTEEAQRRYERALIDKNEANLGDIYYNLGNVRASQNELEEAIDFYKKALRHNPNDTDAKANIEMVNLMMQQQQQQQQQQQSENGEKGDEEKNEKQESQESQQQDSSKEQSKDSQKSEDSKKDEQSKEQKNQSQDDASEKKEANKDQQKAQESSASEEEKTEIQNALQILKQLENREVENMKKQVQMKTKGKSLEKDW